MSEIVVIVVLVGVILYQGFENIILRKKHYEQINMLLDRIMAKDYPMYVQGEAMKEQAKRPLTPEEIFERQQERGVPV